jgi:ribosomal-protein-alanine N-acetyltransferase
VRSQKVIELSDGEILLRPFTFSDRTQWRRVRTANRQWLMHWEATTPIIPGGSTGRLTDNSSLNMSFGQMVRSNRKEARAGRSFAFGIFKGANLIGQINLSGVIYGALRGGHIGYWIDQSYANRGYMTSAVNMVTDFAFSELALHRIEINIRPENEPSIRVAQKCGYLFEGLRQNYLHIDGAWRVHHCYVRENSAIK